MTRWNQESDNRQLWAKNVLCTKSNQISDIVESALATALLRNGWVVLTPWSDARYDFVIEKEGKFYRVQCKKGVKKGAMIFAKASSTSYRNGSDRRYHGEIEFFGLYCFENNKAYLVPFQEWMNRTLRLTLSGWPNGPGECLLASNYELGYPELEEVISGGDEPSEEIVESNKSHILFP